MFIDTHSHLFNNYYDNIEEVIENAKNNNIERIIINGCDMKSNKEVLSLIEKYDILYGTLGFHPTELEDYREEDLCWLEKNLTNEKIVAIGEIGLDYHYDNTYKELQQDVFKKQILLAKKYNLPIVVHSRDAIYDTYNILKDADVKGEIHCFSSSLEMAREFIKLGYYLGVGGVVTFKNARNIVEIVKNINLEHILLETDAPYLTPEPYRKYKNESKYIPVIAGVISQVKNIEIKQIAEVTTSNAYHLFDKMAKK